MAALDKCYVYRWDDYLAFIEWAKGKEYTTPRGCRVKISDRIYHWEKDDFTGETDRPLFCSPVHMDNYLWHNCDLEFIRDWLKDRYSGEGYCKGEPGDIERIPSVPDYVPCSKVKIIKKGMGNAPFRFHRPGISRKVGGWDIDVWDISGGRSLWYNGYTDGWILPDEHDVWTSSTAHSVKSVKSIIRKIIGTWKLPAGCKVVISGRLVGDEWIMITR